MCRIAVSVVSVGCLKLVLKKVVDSALGKFVTTARLEDEDGLGACCRSKL